jgi:FkbM family methyltransferase
VGANVGNHAIFFAREMEARCVVCFEPNSIALELLRINVALNCVTTIDLNLAGYALGDHKARGAIETPHENNLGIGVLKETSDGSVVVATGDELLTGAGFDFIKIDVEGHEIAVLKGLQSTIARDRPIILIEVNNSNLKSFHSWIATRGYAIKERIKRYEVNENFLLMPVDLT